MDVDDAARSAVEAVRYEVGRERERCIGLIRKYLLFNSQRAVSWHEVQDCIKAIRDGRKPEEIGG